MSQLIASFLEATDSTRLSKFSEDANLESLLARFDQNGSKSLDRQQAALAEGVLKRMHTPSSKGFAALVEVLDYLQVTPDQSKDREELTLALEILDLFCKADSVNDTLSIKELGMLKSALVRLDTNADGVLDASERVALRDGLWSPDEFLSELLAKA